MPGSWQLYLDELAEGGDNELKLAADEPSGLIQWRDTDPLTRLRLGPNAPDDWLAWIYVSWRRLAGGHRYQTRVERALVAMYFEYREKWDLQDLGKIYGAAAGDMDTVSWLPLPSNSSVAPDLNFSTDVGLFLYCDVRIPKLIYEISAAQVFAYAGITAYKPSSEQQFPIVAMPHLTFTRLKSVSGTPVVSSSSAVGHSVTLQSGREVYGQSPAGVLTPGSAAMFVERSGHSEPCLLGARHVLGTTGTRVLGTTQNQIGTVVLEDAILDASVADLTNPWVVDYQLPGLNIIPGAPVMPHLSMPVQMFGAKSGHQTGYVTNTNYTAPSTGGVPILNSILTSINAARGDSGALLCSGYYAQPGLAATLSERDVAVGS